MEHEVVRMTRRRRPRMRTAPWGVLVARLVGVVIAAVLLAACTSAASAHRTGRVVTSQYNGWTIRITPTLSDRWRARVQVWPPEVTPETHGGINPYFSESAATESAIVQAATASARRYIDAFRQ